MAYDAKIKALVAQMTYAQAKEIAQQLVAEVEATGVPFNAFLSQYPKGQMGLTPDYVKAMPEYRTLLNAFNVATAKWHKFAGPYNQKFKKEIRDDMMARREAKIAAN
jgi:hypothetical protein